jgi:hypothetical protein
MVIVVIKIVEMKIALIKIGRVIFCLSVCAQLFGCASNLSSETSVPVVDSNPTAQASDAVPSAVGGSESSDLPTHTELYSPGLPPAKVPAPPAMGTAVASLVAQASSQYQAKNYPAAIATAERGLRIDRRAPELYLLLAKSYLQLSNIPLAQQFVQQGIRYAQSGSEIALSLLRVKNTLPH